MQKTEFKKLWKYFVFIFLIIFFVINWNNVSWIFNYKAISGIISDPLQKESQAAISSASGSYTNDVSNYSDKENILEIPKIEITAPLVFVESSDKDNVSQALDRGVVLLPTSVLPGQAGQTVILGHSAPPGWPKIKYDWVFSRMNALEKGDEIFVYFNHKKFTYYVTKKFFLEKGKEIPKDLTSSENSLILITCWPPGKDIKRIAVVAE